MKLKSLLAATLGLALAVSASSGVALAGKPDNPGKSEEAPGQVKKAEEAPAPAPAKASSKREARASGPGVKPSSTTSKWTTCSTGGGQGTSATCAGSHSTKADASKQYGNGTTAAQIANSRGAPGGTILTGPGNSQPHKVAVCPHKSNKSGGVDVHAVKSYDASACEEGQPAPAVVERKVEEHACPPVAARQATTTLVGVEHKPGQKLKTNPRSAHFSLKHGDAPKTVTVTSTVAAAVAAGACAAEVEQHQLASAEVKQDEAKQDEAAQEQQQLQAAPQGEQGGVLGVQAVVSQPLQEGQGGVLGRIGAVAQGELPFTGLPLWLALLAGAALVGAGVGFRRAMR